MTTDGFKIMKALQKGSNKFHLLGLIISFIGKGDDV